MSSWTRTLLSLVVILGLLSGRSQALLISEFMADNQTGIRDAEGDRSDWIEIENPSASAVNLDGWFLTDDSNRLQKWRFPAVTLGPGSRLLVFASGKDKRLADAELHTNFQLGSKGDFLALVRPDGTTLEHSYAPSYPAQFPDIAYGVASTRESKTLFTTNTTSVWKVLRSANDFPLEWAQPNFVDTGWNRGSLALGYDLQAWTNSSATNVARGRSAIQSSTLNPYSAFLGVDGRLTNFTHTVSGTGTNAYWEVTLAATMLMDSVVIRNRSDCCRSRLRDIIVSIRNSNGTGVLYESPLLNPENILGSPEELRLDLTQELAGRIAGNRIRITRVLDPDLSGGGTSGDDAEVLSMAEVEVFGRPIGNSLNPVIRTDLTTAMAGIASSCLVRIPFDDPWNGERTWDRLAVRLRYNDGYVAYLNGVEVARQNAPSPLGWNSQALTNRSKALGFTSDTLDLSAYAALVQPTHNVLAFHAVSSGPEDGEFLIQPLLEGTTARREPGQYLVSATPGEGNTSGFMGVTDAVEFSVTRGFYTQPFEVTLSTITPGAQIRYTLNGSDPEGTDALIYSQPISISKTTALRAIATLQGWRSTPSVTHSYFFLEDIIRQTPQTAAAAGFPANWGGVVPDYGLDPDVIGGATPDRYGGKYAATIREDLRAIPTLALTLNTQDLFGSNGIYSQSDAGGDAFERDASAEMIQTNGSSAFQINAGLRVQGGAFRSDGLTKKHSLRLLFNEKHGPSKLRYPVFGLEAPNQFDTITLRANSNDGYSWGDAAGQPLYIRDAFGRESMRALGGAASHHQFVHLYLNGLYWGLYEMVERPDSSFSAANFGGAREEWDALNSGTPTEGDTKAWDLLVRLSNNTLVNNTNYFRIQGRNPDGTLNPSLTNYLDVPNMIDYMIVNLWMGNSDWPQKNYWIGRRRVESTGYKFYMWDAEWSIGLRTDVSTDRTGVSDGVATPYGACKANAEFRMLFADHLQRHLLGEGALAVDAEHQVWDPAHPEWNKPAARFMKLLEEVRQGLVAESARWGDMHNLVPYTRDEHWAVERDAQLAAFFPLRTDVVLQQFRAAGLFPSVDAPVLSLRSGLVQRGQLLQIGSSGGTVYFTTNGSDPRLIGGTPSPDAVVYSGPFALPGRCQVKARLRSGATWSALTEANYTEAEPLPLRVTEIHYHPAEEGPDSRYFTDDSEFVEVKNVGTSPIDLRGIRFTQGVKFDFSNSSISRLEPGAYAVVAKRREAFEAHYGTQAGLVGLFEGTLANSGDRIVLVSATGEVIQDFAFSPQDNPTTDGLGFSLVIRQETGRRDAWSHASAWRPSSHPAGSPGRLDPESGLPDVRVSEVLSRGLNNAADVIELRNASGSVAAIGGWFLTDDPHTPHKFQIPAGTVIPAGGYITFAESQFDPKPKSASGFGLSSSGDEVWLFSADATGTLTGRSHGLKFGAAAPGITFVEVITSDGDSYAVAAATPTLGQPNSDTLTGSAVFSRFQGSPDSMTFEFIEILNRGTAPLRLADLTTPSNAWRIEGLDWNFPQGTTLAPGGFCVLTPLSAEQFRARYGASAGALLFDSIQGLRHPASTALELQRPDPGSDPIRWITVDTLRLASGPAWPRMSEPNLGLLRRDPGGFGGEPRSWVAGLAQPGSPLPVEAGPSITQEPRNLTVVDSQEVTLEVQATGDEPIHYQWFHNEVSVPDSDSFQLRIPRANSADAGQYRAMAYNASGSALSQPAFLTVLRAPRFTKLSGSKVVLLGANTSLSGSATGIGTLRYQWWFEGSPLVQKTNNLLEITNAQPSQSGGYQLQVTDDLGSWLSVPMKVQVATRLSLVEQPQSVVALEGGVATFQVAVSGTTPVYYRWRRNGVPITNGVLTLDSGTATIQLTNVQQAMAGRYSVTMTNIAPGPLVTSSEAILTVLADADRDGMADVWEKEFGFNPSLPADAIGDADGDGFSNRAEYEAGTNPRSAQSVLQIESVSLVDTNLILSWTAVSNRTYTLLGRRAIDGEAWVPMAHVSNRPTNRIERFVDPVTAGTTRYYRLVTPKQTSTVP